MFLINCFWILLAYVWMRIDRTSFFFNLRPSLITMNIKASVRKCSASEDVLFSQWCKWDELQLLKDSVSNINCFRLSFRRRTFYRWTFKADLHPIVSEYFRFLTRHLDVTFTFLIIKRVCVLFIEGSIIIIIISNINLLNNSANLWDNIV